MKLHRTQARVAKDNHRFRVVNCGRRWGKTTLAIEEIKGVAIFKESRIAYIAPTYQQARDIAWATLKAEMLPITKNVNESRLELEVFNQEGMSSFIYLRGWESIETLRGQMFDFIVVDEIASMRNFNEAWQEVLRPTLTDKEGSALFISTPKGFNHFYDLFNLERTKDEFKSFNFSSFTNPYIPKGELEKARVDLTEDRFAQEYLADFRKTEGLVYKEFDRKKHVFTDEKINVKRVVAGVDWGFTNPAAVIEIKEDTDNNFWVTSEWYKTKQTTDAIVQKVSGFKPYEVYADPAEPDRIEELKRVGLNVREVSKDVVAGINKVRELLKQNRIKVHADCLNLIHEFETYSYPNKKPERNKVEKPIPENDHALDALRYTIYSIEPMDTTPFNYKPHITDW